MYLPPAPLLDQLRRHEDLQLAVYPDPKSELHAACLRAGLTPYSGGYRKLSNWERLNGSPWTGAFGHNFDANPVPGIGPGSILNAEQAERLLVTDTILAGESVLKRWPWAAQLEPVRLSVLVNMAFNMGIGTLAEFKRTLASVAAGEWPQASAGMLASAWASQVGDYSPDSERGRKYNRPGRAWELAWQMRNGEWWGV